MKRVQGGLWIPLPVGAQDLGPAAPAEQDSEQLVIDREQPGRRVAAPTTRSSVSVTTRTAGTPASATRRSNVSSAFATR